MITCDSMKPARSPEGSRLVSDCEVPGACMLRVGAIRSAMREAGPLARSFHMVPVFATHVPGVRRLCALPMTQSGR